MSNNSNNQLIGNIAFCLIIVFLLFGAFKDIVKDFSADNLLSDLPGLSSALKPEKEVKEIPDQAAVFQQAQKERVRHKIDYSTAQEFINQRSLNGTEILELEKRSVTQNYFVRNSNKKIIFYPTTGSSEVAREFMRDFTKLRTSYGHRNDFVFIPVEAGLSITERGIKNSGDRVFYNIKKECGRFCIINVSTKNITSLKSHEIGPKTFELVEVLLKSL